MTVVRPEGEPDLCRMPPHPRVRARLERRLAELRRDAGDVVGARLRLGEPTRVGLNDGVILPGDRFPLGTSAAVVRRAALDRAPLRGTVRVAVVLVDFPDRRLPSTAARRLRDLFFSEGVLRYGSVHEYYRTVSRGAITLDGEVLGPFTLPRRAAEYAGAQNGTQPNEPNARTMAADTLAAVRDQIDLGPYDNDGNGFVDAFVVVHAGRGAEVTGAPGDIWSHKWVLPRAQDVDGTTVYGYLTIPQDARLGVCAHELGHLLFGWPDLYDPDYTSSGVGGFCLMGGGSWGLGGLRPTRPSAWCVTSQGWAPVAVRRTNRLVAVRDMNDGGGVQRLWHAGDEGAEYFLVENRQQVGYDASLPAGGLLVWHVDDAVEGNTDERHYRVALVQADGRGDLEAGRGDGDEGDVWPGSTGAVVFDDGSVPSSRSYGGMPTSVAVREIPASAASMRVRLVVR